MRAVRLVFLLTLLVGAGLAEAETGKMPDPAAAARGARLYEQHCQRCHQKDGVGEAEVPWSIRQPDFIEAMPLDETSHAWHHGDEELAETILDGVRRTARMPAFRGILTEEEAGQVVSYIKSLWSPRIVACQGPRHMSCMH